MRDSSRKRSLTPLDAVRLVVAWALAFGCAPVAWARDFQVLYDLRVDGNVNTPYGGLGRYANLLLQSEMDASEVLRNVFSDLTDPGRTPRICGTREMAKGELREIVGRLPAGLADHVGVAVRSRRVDGDGDGEGSSLEAPDEAPRTPVRGSER